MRGPAEALERCLQVLEVESADAALLRWFLVWHARPFRNRRPVRRSAHRTTASGRGGVRRVGGTRQGLSKLMARLEVDPFWGASSRSRRRPGSPSPGRRGSADAETATPAPFPEGTICRERPRAMGVTEERPLRRKTAGFGGVAPGITDGAIAVRPLLPKDAIGPANAGRSGATIRRTGWDSGCDSGSSSQSHAGAAIQP